MFYIIAGKFNPSNDDFPVKTLITRDEFADKYAQDCTNLLDEQVFRIDTVAVYLPLNNNAFIATHGTANSFVDGEFEAIVEANVSKEDVGDIVGGALDRALDAVYQSSDYLSACGAVCLDVQEIGD